MVTRSKSKHRPPRRPLRTAVLFAEGSPPHAPCIRLEVEPDLANFSQREEQVDRVLRGAEDVLLAAFEGLVGIELMEDPEPKVLQLRDAEVTEELDPEAHLAAQEVEQCPSDPWIHHARASATTSS